MAGPEISDTYALMSWKSGRDIRGREHNRTAPPKKFPSARLPRTCFVLSIDSRHPVREHKIHTERLDARPFDEGLATSLEEHPAPRPSADRVSEQRIHPQRSITLTGELIAPLIPKPPIETFGLEQNKHALMGITHQASGIGARSSQRSQKSADFFGDATGPHAIQRGPAMKADLRLSGSRPVGQRRRGITGCDGWLSVLPVPPELPVLPVVPGMLPPAPPLPPRRCPRR